MGLYIGIQVLLYPVGESRKTSRGPQEGPYAF